MEESVYGRIFFIFSVTDSLISTINFVRIINLSLIYNLTISFVLPSNMLAI